MHLSQMFSLFSLFRMHSQDQQSHNMKGYESPLCISWSFICIKRHNNQFNDILALITKLLYFFLYSFFVVEFSCFSLFFFTISLILLNHLRCLENSLFALSTLEDIYATSLCCKNFGNSLISNFGLLRISNSGPWILLLVWLLRSPKHPIIVSPTHPLSVILLCSPNECWFEVYYLFLSFYSS